MFYLLEDSNKLDEVGAYPQNEKLYHQDKIDSWRLENTPKLLSNKFIEFEGSKMPDFIMRPKARKTDMLTSGPIFREMGIYMSSYFKDQIVKLKLPEHKFYSINVYTSNKKSLLGNYFYFHPIINESVIDFKNSIFVHQDIIGNNKEKLTFSNNEEFSQRYDAILEENTTDTIKPLILEIYPKFKALDLFFISSFIPQFIVSEFFLKMIKETKISGCMVQECNFIS